MKDSKINSFVSIKNQGQEVIKANNGFSDNQVALECIYCKKRYSSSKAINRCLDDGRTLDVVYDFPKIDPEEMKALWSLRRLSNKTEDRSGVWRFRDLMPFVKKPSKIISLNEGNTLFFRAKKAGDFVGLKNLYIKHQGMNPTGSFKDPGMSAAITQANNMNMKAVVCASTGNTSAAMAAYANRAEMLPVVIIPEGQIAYGKLSQALDYGALTIQIKGDFDLAMQIVIDIAPEIGIYVVNSINPFRIEGQKTIVPEILEQLDWNVPDRIVVPGGNLGHASSLAKGLRELKTFGFIKKLPRITIVQAAGSGPLYNMVTSEHPDFFEPVLHPKTLATAIKIGNPISHEKAIRGIKETDGWITKVTEQEIADAKAIVGQEGIGCEPASATSIAGLKKIMEQGTDRPVDPDETVVAILTGNILKDPDYTVLYHTDRLSDEYDLQTKIESKGKKIKSRFMNSPVLVGPDPQKIKKLILDRLQA